MLDPKKSCFYLFLTLLAFDFILLSLHAWYVFHGLQADTYALKVYTHPLMSVLSAFNADGEGTVIAWFSSVKLLLIGIISLTIAWGLRTNWIVQPGWFLIAALFVALSADETASLHETLAGALMQLSSFNQYYSGVAAGDSFKNSFLWVVIFAPLAIIIFCWLVWTFYKYLKAYPLALFACMAAILQFVLAMSMEATVFLAPPVAEWRSSGFIYFYKLGTTVEEFFELVGMNLLIYGLSYFLIKLIQQHPLNFIVKDASVK